MRSFLIKYTTDPFGVWFDVVEDVRDQTPVATYKNLQDAAAWISNPSCLFPADPLHDEAGRCGEPAVWRVFATDKAPDGHREDVALYLCDDCREALSNVPDDNLTIHSTEGLRHV